MGSKWRNDRWLLWTVGLAILVILATLVVWMVNHKEEEFSENKSESESKSKSKSKKETKKPIVQMRPTATASVTASVKIRPQTKTQTKTQIIEKAIEREDVGDIHPIAYGRMVIGENLPPTLTFSQIKLVNYYNKDWKKNLEEESLRFHPPYTQVKVESKQSLIQIVGPREKLGHYYGRLIELVVVNTKFFNGLVQAFSARVDSESGKIIESWGGNIFEKHR
ncbi:MAG: hypothetical protein HQK53_01190 [Oligoflexia bacterium]|nr:hypothetical protein [Oligoflexia bacterium]